jgi:hypothetical protein
MKKEIKYTYITKNAVRLTFCSIAIIGATLWSTCGGLAVVYPESNLYPGLRDLGLVLVAGIIGWAGGLMIKVKE